MMKVPFLKQPQLYKIADEERDKHGDYAEIPVDIMSILEFNLGFKLEIVDGLQAQADVDALLLSGPELIMAIDYEQYWNERFWNRLRFSLAHELGHHIIHVERHPVFKNLNFKKVDEWIDFYNNIPPEKHFSLEWHANQFAGRFLVPRNELVREFEKAKQHFRSTPDGLLEESQVIEICPKIAKKFRVSTECIKYRIYWEGLNGQR